MITFQFNIIGNRRRNVEQLLLTSSWLRFRSVRRIAVLRNLTEEWEVGLHCSSITLNSQKSHTFRSGELLGQIVFRNKHGKVTLQVILDIFWSMRWHRVLNEHEFVKTVVFTNPGQEDDSQSLQRISCIYFKSSFNEMRRHHPAITCNSCKNITEARFFVLHHRRNA